MFRSKWEVEDTFFGAILGAILGVFIDILPIHYITLIIFFFLLFPMALRKAESISRSIVIFVIIVTTLWISLLVYDLNVQSIIDLDKGLVFVVIFLGWLLSLSIRLYRPR